MRKLGVSLAIAAIATVNSAWAADFPKAYEATYESTVPGGGTQTNHYMSDGKGHMRTETSDRTGITQISLMDYPNHSMTTAMNTNGQKQVYKNPLPDYPGDEEYKVDAKDLGTRLIDNHPCHGYEKTFKNGMGSDTWVADDTKNVILTESTDHANISRLKSYSNTVPAFSMSLPSGY